jgi:hypothetical protein
MSQADVEDIVRLINRICRLHLEEADLVDELEHYAREMPECLEIIPYLATYLREGYGK